jgi:hypothetical protein
MSRPRKYSERLEHIPVPLRWADVELICGKATELPFGDPWRHRIAKAAIAGAAALRLDAALGARGAALVDVPNGFRLTIQGRAEDLPALQNALVFFEEQFAKGAQ